MNHYYTLFAPAIRCKQLMNKPIPMPICQITQNPHQISFNNESPYLDPFECRLNGLYVVYGPKGFGKTTFICNEANKFLKSGGYIKYIDNLDDSMNPHKTFYNNFGSYGLNSFRDFGYNLLPNNSLIICDNINKPITPDMRQLLFGLALEANARGTFKIISISENESVANTILNFNGPPLRNKIYESELIKK
jgi:hypothetical protein